MEYVDSMDGAVWNVAFDEGGMILPDRPEWHPKFIYAILPLNVNYIYLTGDAIGDAELERAIKLPNLRGLNISASTVTDAGLRKLHACKQLRELQLYDVKTVSDAAVSEFQQAVPDCDIQR